MKIKDKVIWITGASSGIGEALVYELVNRGCKLILSSRRKEELKRVKASCPTHAQGSIAVLPLNLSDSSTLKLIAEAAKNIFGRIDILINNGGVSQRSLAIETSTEVERLLMEINYFGTINLTKHVLPFMLDQGGGQVVVVSSLVGKFGTPYRSAYAASKHALHGYFDSLRTELWQKNIIFSLICPGFVKTDISINALTATGTKLNQMDDAQANGMPVNVFAKKMIRAIEKDKSEVYIGGRETKGIWIKRFFPKRFEKVIRKMKVR